MSTKSTIAIHDSKSADTPAVFHLYSCCFTDRVSLDVDIGFHTNTTIHFPLPFLLAMADKLQEHVKPIKEILACSEAQLKVRARVSAIRMAKSKFANPNSAFSEENLFEQEFSRLKAIQEQYKEALKNG